MHDPQAELRERFVWPPRRVEGATADAGAPGEPEKNTPARAAREAGSDPAPPAGATVEETPGRARGRAALRVRVWNAIRELIYHAERTWLDVRCPVLSERLDELGWEPDAPGAYCSRCGQSVGPNEVGNQGGCRSCEGTRPPWTRVVRLGAYREPLTRLVHEVKFTRWRRLGNDLGRLLGESVAEAIERERARRPGMASRVLVAPVPSTWRRRLWRGIDHSRVIATAAAKCIDGRILNGLLSREHRRSQLAVLPSERAGNMANAIHPKRRLGMDLSGCLVIVVDDVTTTGATLRGACRAVHEAHRRSKGSGKVEVWGAVLAVTELEGEAGGEA